MLIIAISVSNGLVDTRFLEWRGAARRVAEGRFTDWRGVARPVEDRGRQVEGRDMICALIRMPLVLVMHVCGRPGPIQWADHRAQRSVSCN